MAFSTPVTEWLPGMPITAGRLQYMLERLGASTTVEAYGTVGDGATDDAPAIQEALNAARDAGGGWIVVPPGRYLLATLPLRIYRNTRLTLLPGAVFLRGQAATMLLNGDADQNFTGHTGHGNILVEGGVWDSRGTTAGLTSAAMVLSFGHATGITVRDLEVKDVSGFHAIEFNAIKRGAVERCAFRGYVDPDGTRSFSEAVQLDLAKGAEYFGGFGPYDHVACSDISVTGCYFGASGTAGTGAWPRGVGSHSATITRTHQRVRVSDCSFDGVTQYGVSAYVWDDAAITGNSFYNCGSGVRLRAVILSDKEDTKTPDGTQTNAGQVMRNISVTGNTFRAGQGYDEPIVAIGETTGQIVNLTITGNSIDGSTDSQNGIRLQVVTRATVGTNVISRVNNTGISSQDCAELNITGNGIQAPAAHGITLVDCIDSSASDNVIREPGGSGILVQGGSELAVRGNLIKSPSRAKNGDAFGIRLSTSAARVVINGNQVRANGAGNEAVNALSITNTCSQISRYGNDLRGSWTGPAIDDPSSINTATAATDLS
ncbi:right-handed parallel beta-helix repeat-containing protein [Streptomyces sp. NPDC047046]|uniref:right-handed parallel beta-helix repeat-containing protein n=1 Tax=Streptomyces sp. NPDC047046 TaxID=3155378 RepID=UPI0033C220FA